MPLREVLDSESDPTSASECVMPKLQACFPSVQVMGSVEGAHIFKIRSLVTTTQKAFLLRLAWHARSGVRWCWNRAICRCCLSVISGGDDTIRLRGTHLKHWGSTSLTAHTLQKGITSVKGVENLASLNSVFCGNALFSRPRGSSLTVRCDELRSMRNTSYVVPYSL